jgi:hypothetical protein
MRRTALVAFIAAFMPQVAAAQFVRHNSIPEDYWGTWASATATCTDEDKIVLSSHSYANATISCVVNYVRTTPGPKGPTCSAHLQCSNPAEQGKNKTTANLIIRPGDQGQIFVGPELANLNPYQRCSASEPGAEP